MHVLLGIIVVAFCLYLLSRAIQNARNEPWAGPQSAGMRSRASVPRPARTGRGRTALRSAGVAGRSLGAVAVHPANRVIRAQAKADTHRAWQEAFATNWLEQQRHSRQNGGGGTAATAAEAKPTLRQRLKLAPFTPAAQGPAGNGNGRQPGTSRPGANANGNGANGTGGTSQPAAQGNGGPPARQSPPPPAPAPASTNGGNPVAGTSGSAAEKMIEGIQEIYARAASGGITAKQEAVRAAHESAVRFAGDDADARPHHVRAGQQLRPGDHRAGREGGHPVPGWRHAAVRGRQQPGDPREHDAPRSVDLAAAGPASRA